MMDVTEYPKRRFSPELNSTSENKYIPMVDPQRHTFLPYSTHETVHCKHNRKKYRLNYNIYCLFPFWKKAFFFLRILNDHTGAEQTVCQFKYKLTYIHSIMTSLEFFRVSQSSMLMIQSMECFTYLFFFPPVCFVIPKVPFY